MLPEVIHGDQAPPVELCDDTRRYLSGIPTSGGYYQGPVRVIGSLTEFDKMLKGAVLVFPFSDISWVPLFAQAVVGEQYVGRRSLSGQSELHS